MLEHIQTMLQSKTVVWPQRDKAVCLETRSNFHCKISLTVKSQILTAGTSLDLSAFALMAPSQLRAPKAFNGHMSDKRECSAIKSHQFTL